MKEAEAKSINKSCCCKTLDPDLLGEGFKQIQALRPNLFSATTVFISKQHYHFMLQLISTIEEVIQLTHFKQKVLSCAPAIAQQDFGPLGAMLAYDFHLTDDHPQLIEINTNAGGALLNAELARAQKSCCAEVLLDPQIESNLMEMFKHEWQRQRGDSELKSILILDMEPESQFLYPEFLLFKQLFIRHGYEAIIAAPSELTWDGSTLKVNNKTVDLVYSRLTDFYFTSPALIPLAQAYSAGKVVVTPNPHHHALYANKFNLCLLSDEEQMHQLNLPSAMSEFLLAGIPRTIRVSPMADAELWNQRRDLFFKPAAGYGSKAAFRGDKITRKNWEMVMQGDYVAQKIIPPSQRVVKVDDVETDLKVDIRVYVYAGKLQLLAARLYAGQTTNFRTAGGGFAPVAIL